MTIISLLMILGGALIASGLFCLFFNRGVTFNQTIPSPIVAIIFFAIASGLLWNLYDRTSSSKVITETEKKAKEATVKLGEVEKRALEAEVKLGEAEVKLGEDNVKLRNSKSQIETLSGELSKAKENLYSAEWQVKTLKSKVQNLSAAQTQYQVLYDQLPAGIRKQYGVKKPQGWWRIPETKG